MVAELIRLASTTIIDETVLPKSGISPKTATMPARAGAFTLLPVAWLVSSQAVKENIPASTAKIT